MEKNTGDRANRFQSKPLDDSRKKNETLKEKRAAHKQALDDKKES